MEPLVAALKDKDKYVRKAAAEALGQIGDTRAVEPLIDALKDSDFDVFRNVTVAIAALYRLGTLSESQKLYLLQKGDSLKRRQSSFTHEDYGQGCNHDDSKVHSDKEAALNIAML